MKIDFIKTYYNAKITPGVIDTNIFSLTDNGEKLMATLTRKYCVKAEPAAEFETIVLNFDYEKLYGKKLDLALIANLVKKDNDAEVLYQETQYKNLQPFKIVVDGKVYNINKFDNISGMLFNSFELLNVTNELLQILAKDSIFNS